MLGKTCERLCTFSELHEQNPNKFKGAKGIRDYQGFTKLVSLGFETNEFQTLVGWNG